MQRCVADMSLGAAVPCSDGSRLSREGRDVADAMRCVDRALFAPQAASAWEAYADSPLKDAHLHLRYAWTLCTVKRWRTTVLELRSHVRSPCACGCGRHVNVAHLEDIWLTPTPRCPSAPHMYALVLERMRLRPGMTFLSIGSGSGYLCNMAAHLVGPVSRHVSCMSLTAP